MDQKKVTAQRLINVSHELRSITVSADISAENWNKLTAIIDQLYTLSFEIQQEVEPTNLVSTFHELEEIVGRYHTQRPIIGTPLNWND